MGPPIDFNALVEALERKPELRGRTVAEVPALGDFRRYFRRGFYGWANKHFAVAVLNIAISAFVPLWVLPLTAFAVGLGVFMMLWSERKAQELTRQLQRRASVQLARDICGIED